MGDDILTTSAGAAQERFASFYILVHQWASDALVRWLNRRMCGNTFGALAACWSPQGLSIAKVSPWGECSNISLGRCYLPCGLAFPPATSHLPQLLHKALTFCDGLSPNSGVTFSLRAPSNWTKCRRLYPLRSTIRSSLTHYSPDLIQPLCRR